MERALARHPTMRAARVHPGGDRVLRLEGAPGGVLRGTVRGAGGHDQGARWLPGRGLAGHQRRRAIPAGRPASRSTGNAKRRADALGVTRVLVTFTHEKTNAVAFAIAVRRGRRREAGPHPAGSGRPRPGDAGGGNVRRRPDGAGGSRRGAGRDRSRAAGCTAAARSWCAARATTVATDSSRRGTWHGGACASSVIAVEALDELREPAASNAGRLGEQGLDRTSVQPRRPRRASWRVPTSRSTRSSAPASAACPRTSGPRRSRD